MVMGLALPIDGEAMISLSTKSVRQTRWMLSVLDYGNVMDVSRLGKNSDRLRSQGDLEVKMRERAVSFLVLRDDAKIAGGGVLMCRGLSRDLSDEEVGAQILAVVHGAQNLTGLKPKPLAKQ